MGRWEPNARERLERAALALFTERGYDATTVNEIADRAGLTKSTFFRQFADKREVLFGRQDVLAGVLTGAIQVASASATIVDCIAAALEASAVAFTPERQKLAPQRRAVIAANSDLQERSLLKLARLATAVADALKTRGADDVTAKLAAEMCVLAFDTAYERWAVKENERPYNELARAALAELQTRATALGTGSPRH